jgi:hypothetical protein
MATKEQTAQGLGLAIFGVAAGGWLSFLAERADDASGLATVLAGYYKTEMKKDLSVDDVLANLQLKSGTAAYTAAKATLEMQVAGGATLAVAASSLVTYLFGLTDTTNDFYATSTAFKARVDVAVAWSKGAGATEKSVAALVAYQAGVDNPGPVEPPVPEVITTALTTAADNLPGTVGADAFTGVRSTSSTLGTLGATDKIDGGEGTDSLTVSMTSDFTGFTTGSVKSVEVISLTNTGDVARNFDATGVVGTATYNLDSKTGLNLTNADTLGTVNVLNRASGTTTVDFADAKVSTTTDNSLTLGVTGLGAGTTHVTVTAPDIQKMTVVASGGASNVNLAGSPLKSVTITGESDLSLRATAVTTLTAIDGSAATGKLTLGTLPGTFTSIKTGSADDAVTIGAITTTAVLSGGAGNDKITLNLLAADTYQPVMTGFETLVLSNTAGAVNLSLSKSTDLANVTVDALGGTLTMVKAGTGALNVSAKGTQSANSITTDTTGAVSFSTVAADTVTTLTNDINALAVTASKAASLAINVAKYTNTTGAFSAGEAKSLTLDAKGGLVGAITAAKATDLTITASETVTLTGSTLTAVNSLSATAAKSLTLAGLSAPGTMTLAGTGTTSALTTGALGAAANTQALALTATGWKGGATIGAIDSQDTISVDVSGVTGAATVGIIGGNNATATPTGSVTINATGALGAVKTGAITVGAGKTITVTDKDAVAAVTLGAMKVTESGSNPTGAITVDVSGGIATTGVGALEAATVTVNVTNMLTAATVDAITALTLTYTGDDIATNDRSKIADVANNVTFTGGSAADKLAITHQDTLFAITGTTATTANAETHALSISTGAGDDVIQFTTYAEQIKATYTGSVALGSGTADSFKIVSGTDLVLLDAQTLTVTGAETVALDAALAAAAITVYGTTVADTITGSAFADTIISGAGNDTITGGLLGDAITAGAGADLINVAVLDTAVAANFAAAAATATFSASQTTVDMDVITGFAAGDTIQLSSGAAIVTGTTLLTGATATLGAATAGDVILLRGTYNSSANTFVGSLTGTSSLLVYDTTGTAAAGTYEGIVLVGYVDSTGNDTISAAGLFTGV